MTPTPAGVAASYRDATGVVRRVPAHTRRLVAAAVGADQPSPAFDAIVARPGQALDEEAVLVTEDGVDLGAVTRLPHDLPLGYHTLQRRDDSRALVLAAPARCPLPRGLRAWGWSVQLYAARSAASWGIGDLGDLAALGRTAAAQGAGFLAVSPLAAPNPGPDPEPSPYSPGTRRFLSPLHLRIDATLGADLRDLAADAARLNDGGQVDRRGVMALKAAALERAWTAHAERPPARPHPDEHGLLSWATYNALAERFGSDWRTWPAELRDPSAPAVGSFGDASADRVAFHAWVQRLLDQQLAVAGAAAPGIGLLADLPVGFDPGGFDAWAWQGVIASGVSLGAPPDPFNLSGQDWGLPPFVPHRLRAAHYRPLADTLRAAMRHAGGLRIDHVLGLFRQWWVPHGEEPAAGTYVRFPADELLAVVAIEATRAQAVVVGEDLGTMSRGVRARLARANVLGMRLVWFDDPPATSWPPRTLGAVTNHDLPTVVGTWTAADLDDQARAGLAPDAEQLADLRQRLRAFGGATDDAEASDVVLSVHRAVAEGASVLVSASLEDACRMATRPNIPGTIAPQRANWSHVLPLTVEQLATDPFVASLTASMQRGRRPRLSPREPAAGR